MFIGETEGYHHAALGPEDGRDNWGTITSRDGYAVPSSLGDETALFLPFLQWCTLPREIPRPCLN